ncbi:MAG: IS256 family transposase, partial [Desulfobaccales bacterium]
DFKEIAGNYLTALMEWELTIHLGRNRYERRLGTSNHRNGSYPRHFTIKGIGEVEVKVPRDRQGTFQTAVLPKGRQYEEAIAHDLSMMFLAGLSTRTLSMLSRRLIGRSLSHTEISQANVELTEAVERWRTRDLSQEQIQYLFVDGVNFDMRLHGSVGKVPVLVVIGVTVQGHKLVLGLQAGDKESATSWRELFRDLKDRGLDGSRITLGVMDGLSGLEGVFKEEFPRARVQRCQVHVSRNVLAKVPHKLKAVVAEDLAPSFMPPARTRPWKPPETSRRAGPRSYPRLPLVWHDPWNLVSLFTTFRWNNGFLCAPPTSSSGSTRSSNVAPDPWRSWPGNLLVINSWPLSL